ncbi:hypothetical protein E2565_06945 [Ligilactobacillus salivarius]|nr:hypothetical protein E2565_06945 [Ligilactobacillus salivarius]
MLVGTGIIVFFIISYYGSLTGLLVKVHTLQGNLLRNNVETAKVIPNDAIIRNSNYNNIFDYSILYGETDYYPKMAFDNLEDRNVSVEINPKINSILLHKVIMGNKGKIETPKVTANRIEYSVKVNKKEKIDVPVLAYKRTKVMLNGRNVNYTVSPRGTVMVDGNKGNNKISVTYQPSKLLYVGIIVATITWLGLFVGLIFLM